MDSHKKLLKYFMHNFRDEDLKLPKSGYEISISMEEFERGELSEETIEAISKLKDMPDFQDTNIEYHICPCVLKNSSDQKLMPLFIPSQIQDKVILPIAHRSPYIPRDYLESNKPQPESSNKTYPVLGQLEDMDDFMLKRPYYNEKNWREALRYAQDLFKAVTGSHYRSLSVDGYRLIDTVLVVPMREERTHKKVIELYEHLLSTKNLPPLLRNYLTLDEVKKEDVTDSYSLSERHLGQMNASYPLTKGQREALHHFLTLKDGEMLAVNGPPGTGKTTLLQNVVASLWVESAANGDDDPPVIVASSNNNKAITNILDSFARAESKVYNLSPTWKNKVKFLEGRWIPGVKSYGLYLPSKTEAEKLMKQEHNYQIIVSGGENFMEQMEDDNQYPNLKEVFLNKCSFYTGTRIVSLQKAVEVLRKDLNQVREQIQEGIRLMVKHRAYQKELKQEFGGSIDGVRKRQNELVESIKTAEDETDRFRKLKEEWNNYQNEEPVWWAWFSFLPAIQKRRKRRNENFVFRHKDHIHVQSYTTNEIDTYIIQGLKQAESDKESAEKELYQLKVLEEEVIKTQERLLDWCQEQGIPLDNQIPSEQSPCQLLPFDPEPIVNSLDTGLRYISFLLATHYWEGKWLLEMEERLKTGHKESKSSKNTMKKWRRYAKLTPCVVATFYKTPEWFCGYDPNVEKEGSKESKPKSVFLLNFIDLLIIDEAGQVLPELAAPTFALAKKALVVGDTMQIEPISNLTQSVDRGNLQRCKVVRSENEFDDLEEKGVTSKSGSVMKIAQRRSKYWKVEGLGGMFLSEHYRCVPEIIQYCNELAYKGKLKPKRPSEKKYEFLPHLGYAHIEGEVMGKGSKFNPDEAEVIARWVKENAKKIEQISNKKLEEVLGIITPFRYQKALIEEFLKELGVRRVTVGTVHALQGDEKDIVIFSPVVGPIGGKKPFYDQNKNILNVAVSRAKDSFLVFGNMDEFGLIPGTPSFLLKHHLYKKENEIMNVPKERSLFARLVERSRGNSKEKSTVIQQIIKIGVNHGQIIGINQSEVHQSQTIHLKEEKQVNEKNIHISGNVVGDNFTGNFIGGDFKGGNFDGGQQIGRDQKMNSDIFVSQEVAHELKQRIEQLAQELNRSDQLNNEFREEILKDLHQLEKESMRGNIERGILERLNERLSKISAIISGSSALGQCVSAMMSALQYLSSR